MNKRRKLITAVLAIVLCILIILPLMAVVFRAHAVTQQEINELKEKASELADRQKEITEKLNAISDEKDAVQARQALLDERINTTYEQIEIYNAQAVALDSRIAYQERELEKREEEEAVQMELFRRRVRAIEEAGTISYFSILFDAASFADLLSRIDDINEIMSYNEYVVKGLKDAQAATQAAREELAATRAEVDEARAQEEEKKHELDIQLAEMQVLMVTLEEQREQYELTYEENEKLEEELTEKITELQKEYDRQLEEERKRREEEERRKQQQGGSGSGSGSNSGSGIVSTGTYMWPVNDSRRCVTSPFGWRVHPILGTRRFHNGIDIGSWYGCAIFAADSGTVTTSEWSDSYGNYVMIAHGNGRYTLYAHMSSRACSVGQTVSKGDVIGYVGSTGLSNGNHCHFETWVNGSRVDPLGYFSTYWRYWD
ncbi:MAG: peptidoglycan DD-metalloendopeptidase family protein [Oscillospiraceae bacterium]|nr:peptidoglycan DD-metalloendopeptidase family protein [Oscillospiraceae bacterium]